VRQVERQHFFVRVVGRQLDRLLQWTARHWRLIVLLYWLGAAGWLLWARWRGIMLFQLGDTDDNMRMSEVRAWLAGQGWFDLRQYKLDPPNGANIHWSRIVDLPLAGLITAGKLFTSGANAERFAIAVAPLLPFIVAIGALALVVRRLVHEAAFPLALIALFFAASTNGMFAPTRIDHHGWQLTMLAIAIAGLADPKAARGGIVTGLATAVSLSIGLEMLIYLALAGAAQVLMWVDDRDQRPRLSGYAASLAGGTAVGFVLFASYANRLPVCDALSPVWLSDAMLGGALLLALSWWSPADWRWRLGVAAAAGAVIAVFHALSWPHCLSRLEGVSPEVERLWLNNVREAKPIYEHTPRIAIAVASLPAVAVFGWALLLWKAKGEERDRFRRTMAVAAIGLTSFALLFWQTRAGPAAQLLGTIGAAALVWHAVPLFWRSKNALISVVGTTAAFLVGLGIAAPFAAGMIHEKAQTERDKAINRANNLCPSLAALKPVAQLPQGTVFTFVDLAPRLITVTHHRSIAGPYHRNGPAIADVMKAFRGSPEQARTIIGRRHADYVMICPNMSQATVFMAAAPRGFYAQLERGQVPGWLQPIPLPKDNPLRIWRVIR
jgi:hypothetical protein